MVVLAAAVAVAAAAVAGGAGISAAPEPAYLFSFLGGFVSLIMGRRKLRVFCISFFSRNKE